MNTIIKQEVLESNNGNIPKWNSVLEQLKEFKKGELSLNNGYLKIQSNNDKTQLESILKKLTPWRKGPFMLGDLKLESEWLGYKKWLRVEPHISPLKNKKVLDIGAGNGYFSFIFALFNAKEIVAIEPFLLFYFQFLAITSLVKEPLNIDFIPKRFEELEIENNFDTVFSMGVLYHQKSPIEHLLAIKKSLVSGGELVLETLIVAGELGYSLMPQDRYAKMRNVWFLPSIKTLTLWLERCGFENIRCVDVNQTDLTEQRATDWIGDNTKSLKDFLNPKNPNLTIEGYPAPKRAIFICNKT